MAHLIFVLVLYAWTMWGVVFDPRVAVSRDNLLYHLPQLIYFGGSLLHGFGLPYWVPSSGGLPVGATSISMFPFAPHKLASYALYVLSPLDVETVYKLSILAGMALTVVAWWFVLRRIAGSRTAATLGCLAVILGGSGITVFHQEQVLVTMMPVPWIALVLQRLGRDPRFLPVLAVLGGVALTVHYPHIHMLASLFAVLAFVLAGRLGFADIRAFRARPVLVLFSIFLFAASASPAFYVRAIGVEFSSPIRGTLDLGGGSIESYLGMSWDSASASWAHMGNILSPAFGAPSDRFLCYVPRAGLMLALLGGTLGFRRSLPYILLVFMLLWAALGTHGYLPHILYTLHFPLIGYFRQWYHFVPYLLLTTSVVVAVGGAEVLGLVRRRLPGRRGGLMAAALAVGIVAAVAAETDAYVFAYASRHLGLLRQPLGPPGAARFGALMKSGSFTEAWIADAFGSDDAWVRKPEEFSIRSADLMQYRGWFLNDRSCERPPAPAAFTTHAAYAYTGLPEELLPSLLKSYCTLGLDRKAVLLDLSGLGPEPVGLDLARLSHDGKDRMRFSRFVAGDERKPVADEDFTVTPREVVLRVREPGPGLAVVPYAYGLGFHVVGDGLPLTAYPIMGGAYSGVVADGGTSNLRFQIAYPAYYTWLALQYALLAGAVCAAFILGRFPSRPRRPGPWPP